jgi:protein phosphatase 2C family protein 2/3
MSRSLKHLFPRLGMEDAHSLHLSLPPAEATETAEKEKPSVSGSDAPEQPSGSTFTNQKSDGPAFFGVFDGHGGSAVARFTGTTIHSRLAALEAYSE